LPYTNLGCVQLIDDSKHPVMQELGVNRKPPDGALYDLFPLLQTKLYKGAGTNYGTRIVSKKGNHVEHWLNGKNTGI